MNRPLRVGAAAIVLLGPSVGAGEIAPITDRELAAMQSRFEALRGQYETWNKGFEADLEKADDALAVERVRKGALPTQAGYVRFLLMLDEDARLLANPVDEVGEAPDSSGFTSQERRKLESLREDILEAEVARIRSALKERRGVHDDEKAEEKIYRDEMSLDGLFDRQSSKLRRNIARAERDLAKETGSERPDERRVASLEQDLAGWREEMAALHQYVYGFGPGEGWPTKPGPATSGPAAEFLAALAAERGKVIRGIKGDRDDGGEAAKKGGLVGGSFLYSSNLGVVLDISGSMTPHIEKLKEEIAETFEAPRYREVVGCRLRGTNFGARTLADLGRGSLDTMTVIEELCVVWGVDTIYWFNDLRDGFDARALRRLRRLLMRSGAAFHVQSMANRPERELKPLIDDFQG